MSTTLIACIILMSGVYYLMASFMLKTRNFSSSFFFKFIPFILGLADIIIALKMAGML